MKSYSYCSCYWKCSDEIISIDSLVLFYHNLSFRFLLHVTIYSSILDNGSGTILTSSSLLMANGFSWIYQLVRCTYCTLLGETFLFVKLTVNAKILWVCPTPVSLLWQYDTWVCKDDIIWLPHQRPSELSTAVMIQSVHFQIVSHYHVSTDCQKPQCGIN